MALLQFKHKGDFKKTDTYFRRLLHIDNISILERYGNLGVEALSNATPVDTGKTAASWSYVIQQSPGRIKLYWTNSNVNKGVNIAIILQYGHGLRGGGYVEGIDYINPAIQPIFDEMAQKLWKEVTSN